MLRLMGTVKTVTPCNGWSGKLHYVHTEQSGSLHLTINGQQPAQIQREQPFIIIIIIII